MAKSRKERSASVNSRQDGGGENYERLLKHREKRKAAAAKENKAVLAIEYPTKKKEERKDQKKEERLPLHAPKPKISREDAIVDPSVKLSGFGENSEAKKPRNMLNATDTSDSLLAEYNRN